MTAPRARPIRAPARARHHRPPTRAQHYPPPGSRSRPDLTTRHDRNQPRTPEIRVMPGTSDTVQRDLASAPAPSHQPRATSPRATRTEPPASGITCPVTYISLTPSLTPTPCAPRPVHVRAPPCGIDPPESPSHLDPPETGPHPPQPIVAGQGHERQLRFSGASTSHPRTAREPENVRPARYLRTDIEDDWTFERI